MNAQTARRFEDLLPASSEPTPYDYGMMFKADGFFARWRSKKRFSLLKGIDVQLRRVLHDGEKVFFMTPGTTVSIMAETPNGVKAYVEIDDAKKRQWVVVRGTSNLENVKLDMDYNKVVDGRLQIPLHKGFADTALQVYRFAKPLLKPGYETRITGHSLGGAAAVIVLMLLKEDGMTLGPAMTFGQPKVTNRQGVEKYRSLPLLRFVNDKDPVPLLPPLDIASLLDEGPFQHFGPEVVLKDGTSYAYYPDHQASRMSVLSFWTTLGNQQVPDHAIANYIQSLKAKTGGH